jgi:glycosyltransferase involved in cell wall biosynthesis
MGADYHFVKSNETFILRHALKAGKTLSLIFRYRKGLIVVQNPSRILAAIASLMKLVFGFPLVVDRHTNFRLGKGFTVNPAVWFVILCSEFSLRVADLTIVTNNFLKELVESKGGKAIVLHDKLPDLRRPRGMVSLPSGKNILFVCTYAPDEPFMEVISAAEHLPEDCHIHISGNYRNAGIDPDSPRFPRNVHLLGFVSREDYDAYVFSCDAIMVLTTSEYVIVCGGYEAAAARKPLITSTTNSLKEFYQSSAVYTEPAAEPIANAILSVCSNTQKYEQLMESFVEFEKLRWDKQWKGFLSTVSRL